MHIPAMLSKFILLIFYCSYCLYDGISKYLPDGQHHYWESNYARLQQIKAKFDPENVFSNPQSVKA